jgi:hypothetical protein
VARTQGAEGEESGGRKKTETTVACARDAARLFGGALRQAEPLLPEKEKAQEKKMRTNAQRGKDKRRKERVPRELYFHPSAQAKTACIVNGWLFLELPFTAHSQP